MYKSLLTNTKYNTNKEYQYNELTHWKGGELVGIAGSSVVALVALVAAESDKGTSKQAAQVLSAIQSTVLATYYTCALASPTSTNTQVIPTATAPWLLHLTQFTSDTERLELTGGDMIFQVFSQTMDKTSGASVPSIPPFSFCGQNRQLDNNVAVTGLWHLKTACIWRARVHLHWTETFVTWNWTHSPVLWMYASWIHTSWIHYGYLIFA